MNKQALLVPKTTSSERGLVVVSKGTERTEQNRVLTPHTGGKGALTQGIH